jgi:hypothetical protein
LRFYFSSFIILLHIWEVEIHCFKIPQTIFFFCCMVLSGSFKFLHIFFIVVLSGGTLCHLQKFLQYIKYCILESIPSISLLYSLPHFWNSFQQVSFLNLHTCVHNICTIFILTHNFSTSSPLSLEPTLFPDRTWSVILFSNFLKE